MLEKICIILLANILFYAKTIYFLYVSDDIPSAQRPRNPIRWKHWLYVLEGHEKHHPQYDHLISLGLHTLVSAFIYTGFGANDVSFLAALLFSLNPINNQGSVWISGRGYVLSALGMTMALTFPYIGLIFLLLATYSNAGFLAPFAFLGSPHPELLVMAIPCWAWWGRNFKKNVVEKMKMEMYTEDKKIHPIKLVLFAKTFGFYLTHSIIPVKTTFYHSYMQSMAGAGKDKAYSFKDRFLYIGIASIAGIVYYWLTVPWNMVSFGLLWWCICIAPFCNLFRMSQEIGERYCYLPNIGLMIVLSSFLQSHPMLSTIWATMYATKTWFYIEAFKDDYTLVETSKINSPDAWFAWHVSAMRRWEQKSYQEAVILWTMARFISPKEFKILFNIATALKLSKHDKEAEYFINQAADNVPAGQEQQAGQLLADWRSGKLSVLL